MKSTVSIIAGIFCFVMVPVAMIGGIVVTLAMPEVYKASATISVSVKGEEKRSYEKSMLNKLTQKLNSDSVFHEAASEKGIQEYCGTVLSIYGKPMSKADVYRLLRETTSLSLPNANSGLIEVSCHTRVSGLSFRLANRMAETCVNRVNSKTTDVASVSARLVSCAQRQDRPSSPCKAVNMAVSLSVAGVFAIGGIILLKTGSKKLVSGAET